MYKKHYETWLQASNLTEEEQAELLAIQADEMEIKERFHAPLSFGTAGMRGIMGLGLHRMNKYIIRHATQAFANVILAKGDDAAKKGIIIAYDCRNNAQFFAEETASVMAANGISVRLFPSMRPTPQLSFAIRHFGATAGVNLTASHNPKEYSGYKVYWSDGAQLPTAFANEIAKEMQQIDLFSDVKSMDYHKAVQAGDILLLGQELDDLFIEKVLAQRVLKTEDAQLKLVYTPFHGAGADFVPKVLEQAGFSKVFPVLEQMVADGNFPTVKSPNPEDPEGFALALQLAKEKQADIIVGTDPDADRVGVMVLHDGTYHMISGNQLGVLLFHYIIQARIKTQTMPKNPVFIQSIVTTDMSIDLAKKYGIASYKVFTGFKHMAEKMAHLNAQEETIFSFEESFGYMIGDFIRDKDGITTSLFVAQMAQWYQDRGMSLIDGFAEIETSLGMFYEEMTLNLIMPGVEGLKNMQALMQHLREHPPQDIAGYKVCIVRDYQDGSEKADGKVQKMELSGSNVLGFTLEDGTNFLVRPSGTEPKIKIYILAKGENRKRMQEVLFACKDYAKQLTTIK